MGTLLKSRSSLALAAVALMLAVVYPTRADAGPGTEGRTVIACHGPREFRYLSQPENCELFARRYRPNGQLRGYINIVARHLRWRGWGEPVAVAKGRFSTAEPLRVVAFDRVHCRDGRWYYGRVAIHGRPGGGKGVVRLRLVRCGMKQFGALPKTRAPW